MIKLIIQIVIQRRQNLTKQINDVEIITIFLREDI